MNYYFKNEFNLTNHARQRALERIPLFKKNKKHTLSIIDLSILQNICEKAFINFFETVNGYSYYWLATEDNNEFCTICMVCLENTKKVVSFHEKKY